MEPSLLSRMKIACVLTYGPDCPEAWPRALYGYYLSGTRKIEALRSAGADIQILRIAADNIRPSWRYRCARFWHTHVHGTHYPVSTDLRFQQRIAKSIEHHLTEGMFDVIFCPENLHALGMVDTALPIVLWTDAQSYRLTEYYELCVAPPARRSIFRMEKANLRRASLILYLSKWAKESAHTLYGVPENRMVVIPTGPNTPWDPTEEEVKTLIERRCSSPALRLLFLGSPWKRKGGAQAVAVLRELRRRGIPATLDIVGCAVPKGYAKEPFLESYGFLSMHTEEGLQALRERFQEAALLLMPSKAECFGHVCSEANAFGIPVLATQTGGLAEQIRPGENGWSFALEAPTSAWADRIETCWRDPELYRAVALRSWERYREHYRWEQVGQRALEQIQSTLG